MYFERRVRWRRDPGRAHVASQHLLTSLRRLTRTFSRPSSDPDAVIVRSSSELSPQHVQRATFLAVAATIVPAIILVCRSGLHAWMRSCANEKLMSGDVVFL